jgi:S-formylglutathione hydrolase FrmB
VTSPAPRRSRRAFLLGAGAAGLTGAAALLGVERGVLPGRSSLFHALHLDGRDGRLPDVRPVPTVSGSFVSAARLGTRVGWTVCAPPTAEALPVVLVLHGRGGDHRQAFGSALGLDRFLAVALASGVPPFALASVDGGDSYWHPRDSGEDAGAMVVDELLPLLGRRGLEVSRTGFLGWSMGGFGALRLAGVLGPDRARAVAAESPALWQSFADAAPGAFDDAADLADATVFGRQRSLDGIAVRVDCGEGDPFYEATKAYRAGFTRPPAGGFEPGDHDLGYWRRMAPAQLRFLGRALAA